MDQYSQGFRFLRDDIELIAQIEPESQSQKLIFKKLRPNTQETEFWDSVDCIHTAIARVPYEKFESAQESEDSRIELMKSLLNIRSSEQMENINLDLDEKWFAFKSWVQGIAEAGMDALKIQSEIEVNIERMIPIAQFLFKNLIRVDPEILPEYLFKIEKECRFEGKYHKPSMRANLRFILDFIARTDVLHDVTFDLKLIHLNDKQSEFIHNCLLMIADMDAEFLFQYPLEEDMDDYTERIPIYLANNREFMNYPEFRYLFNCTGGFVKEYLAQSELAAEHPDFSRLFTDPDNIVRMDAAKNPKAPELPEYRILFNDSNIEVLGNILENTNPKILEFPEFRRFFADDRKEFRYSLSMIPEIVKFPEHREFFSDSDFFIRRNILSNPNAGEFSERANLFPKEWGGSLEHILDHPDAPHYSEYRMLYCDPNTDVRCFIARDPHAVHFSEYGQLFVDSESKVRIAVAQTLVAASHPNYSRLIYDKNLEVRKAVAANPNAIKVSKYSDLISDKNAEVRRIVAANPYAVELPDYPKLLDDKDWRVRTAIAKNPRVSEVPNFQELLNDSDDRGAQTRSKKKSHVLIQKGRNRSQQIDSKNVIHLKKSWSLCSQCSGKGTVTEDFRLVTCPDCKNTATYQWHINPNSIGDRADDYELFGVTTDEDYLRELRKWQNSQNVN